MLRYAITDGKLLSPLCLDETDRLAARCGELAAEGVDFILLREKQLSCDEVAEVCARVVAQVRGRSRLLLPARCFQEGVGAAGVHVSGEWKEMPSGVPASVSCHSVEEVRRACAAGAALVLFAPVYGKWVDGVEVVPGVGLGALHEACAAAGEVLVLALGGVDWGNAAECVRAGAAGVAGIRMFSGDRVSE